MNGDNYDAIQHNMIGRIGITKPEAELMLNAWTPTDLHIEIGCLWGGTAILAASACAHVITIDLMYGGFWEYGDPEYYNIPPSADHILGNFSKFRLAHKISLYKGKSDPWPFPETMRPDTLLIDGGHGYEVAKADWENAIRVTKRTIFIHDYDEKHPGVVRVVNEIVGDWSMVARADTMLRLDRV